MFGLFKIEVIFEIKIKSAISYHFISLPIMPSPTYHKITHNSSHLLNAIPNQINPSNSDQ